MPSLLPRAPSPDCPRCGGTLRRQPRKTVHRIISVVHPVKFYSCERNCGWSGALSSRSGLEERNRRIQMALLLVMAVLGMVLGAKVVTETMANAASQPTPEE